MKTFQTFFLVALLPQGGLSGDDANSFPWNIEIGMDLGGRGKEELCVVPSFYNMEVCGVLMLNKTTGILPVNGSPSIPPATVEEEEEEEGVPQEESSPGDEFSIEEEAKVAAASRVEAYHALVRVADYFFFRKRAFPEAASAYESALRVRDIVIESDATASIEVSVDTFIFYALSLEYLFDEKSLFKAIQVLEEAATLYPDHPPIHYNLGVYFFNLPERASQERAIEEFEIVLQHKEFLGHSDALFNRAMALLHMGRSEEAAQSLEDGVEQALRDYNNAWFENSAWLFREHQKLLRGIVAQPSRIKHLQDFAQSALPLLDCASQKNDNEKALIMEFGVAGGESIAFIASHATKICPGQLVHGFDSFLGLPERWHSDEAGEYSQKGMPPTGVVPENVRFHTGWFNESLPSFLAQYPNSPVAAIHMDADLYSSTVEVLDLLVPRMPPGCIVRFDEYYLLRAFGDEKKEDFDKYEAKAWKDTMAKYGIESQPLSFHGQSVTFVVLKNPSYLNATGALPGRSPILHSSSVGSPSPGPAPK